MENKDGAVTDSSGWAGSTPPTAISLRISESAGSYTELARRMTEHLNDPEREVQRQTVARYAQKSVERMPAVEMVAALAYALDERPARVLHLFIRSLEQYYREQLGLPAVSAPEMESLAHNLADRVDVLDTEVRRRVLWVLRTLVESAETEAVGDEVASHTASGVEAKPQESAGARLRRQGDRLLIDIGAAYDNPEVHEDGHAAIDFLARRRGTGEDQEESDSSRST